jgi:hypothetical protein
MLQKRASSWKPLYQLSGIAAQGVSIARQVAHLALTRVRVRLAGDSHLTLPLDSRLAAPGTVRVAGHSPVQNRNAIREKRRRQFCDCVTSIYQKHVDTFSSARSSITSVLVVAVKDTMRE